MSNVKRAHQGKGHRRAVRRFVSATALAAACGLLPASAARAVQVNEISPGFPLVNDTVGNFAVNYAYNSMATAGFPPDDVTHSYNDVQTFYPTGNQVINDSATQVSASAPTNFGHMTSAYVTQSGHIGQGKIGGYVDANVTDGTAGATTTLTLTYIDKIHMNSDTELTITPTVTGTAQHVSNPIDPTGFANTSAELDTYFFTATNPPPTAGVAFPAAYYARTDISSLGQTLTVEQNQFTFPAGSDWWFALEFTLRASGNINYQTDGVNSAGDAYTAVGDFQHTAFTTLDDPNNGPDPVYTSASGIDYSSAALLPEPAAFAAIIIPAAAAALRRRRRL